MKELIETNFEVIIDCRLCNALKFSINPTYERYAIAFL